MESYILLIVFVGVLLTSAYLVLVGGKSREVASLQAAIDGKVPALTAPSQSADESVLTAAIAAVRATGDEWRVDDVTETSVDLVRGYKVPHLAHFIGVLLLTPVLWGPVWIIDAVRDKWRYRFGIRLDKAGRPVISKL